MSAGASDVEELAPGMEPGVLGPVVGWGQMEWVLKC